MPGKRLRRSLAAILFLAPLLLTHNATADVGKKYVDQAIDIRLLTDGGEIRYSLFPSALYRASLISEIDGDGDRRISVEERTKYYGGLVPALARQTEILLDGKRLDLAQAGELESAGAVGEVVFRFRLAFPPLGEGEHALSVKAGAFGDDTRECRFRVSAGEGILLESVTSKNREIGLGFRVAASGYAEAPPVAPRPAAPREVIPERKGFFDLDYVVSRIYGEGSIFQRCLLALTILAVGFLHAVGPGHGKTIASLYLVGVKATVKDAVLLSVLIAFFHIFAVVVLTLAFYLFSAILVSNEYYNLVVRVLSGSVVAVIGAGMLVSSLRRGGAHSHGHDHDHGVSRFLDREKPMGFAGVIGLSFSCGIIPCSGGFIIMLTAISLGKVVMGIAVLLLFAAGVFAAIMLVSIAVVKGKLFLAGRHGYSAMYHWLPGISSLLIIVMGVYLVVTALR